MTIKDFIEVFNDTVDVYDNYCEELCVAYCGEKLTPEGEKHFAEALNLPVIEIRSDVVIVGVNMPGLSEKSVEKRLAIAKEFFESVAGQCSAPDWDKWIVSEKN